MQEDLEDAAWTDLGFVRIVAAASVAAAGLAAPSPLVDELCSPLWIQLLIHLVSADEPVLIVQLQAVRLLQVPPLARVSLMDSLMDS